MTAPRRRCKRCGKPLPQLAVRESDDYCSRACCELDQLGYTRAAPERAQKPHRGPSISLTEGEVDT